MSGRTDSHAQTGDDSRTAAAPATVGVAGDWHGATGWAKRAIEALPDHVRTLIHLGDFGFMGSNFVGEYVHKVNRFALDRDLTILVVPGNHENYDWLAKQPVDDDGRTVAAQRILTLPRGYRFAIGGLTACAVGGAVSVDQGRRTPGKTWWPQEEISEDQATEIAVAGPVDLLFTHDMPLDSGCPSLRHQDLVNWAGERIASTSYAHHRRVRDITEALTPSRLLHGHMHNRYTNKVTWNSVDGQPFDCTIDGLACDGMEGNLALLRIDGGDSRVTDLEVGFVIKARTLKQ